MKFTPEIGQEILQAIQTRLEGKPIRPCPLCGNPKWSLKTFFVTITTTDEPQKVTLGGTVLPSVVLMCPRCGNTHFLNMVILGLEHLLKPSTPASASNSPSVSLSASVSPSPAEEAED